MKMILLGFLLTTAVSSCTSGYNFLRLLSEQRVSLIACENYGLSIANHSNYLKASQHHMPLIQTIVQQKRIEYLRKVRGLLENERDLVYWVNYSKGILITKLPESIQYTRHEEEYQELSSIFSNKRLRKQFTRCRILTDQIEAKACTWLLIENELECPVKREMAKLALYMVEAAWNVRQCCNYFIPDEVFAILRDPTLDFINQVKLDRLSFIQKYYYHIFLMATRYLINWIVSEEGNGRDNMVAFPDYLMKLRVHMILIISTQMQQLIGASQLPFSRRIILKQNNSVIIEYNIDKIVFCSVPQTSNKEKRAWMYLEGKTMYVSIPADYGQKGWGCWKNLSCDNLMKKIVDDVLELRLTNIPYIPAPFDL